MSADANRVIELEAKCRKLIDDDRDMRLEIEDISNELDEWRSKYKR